MLIADTEQTLRRRIGDTDSSSYLYDDATLQGFIADATNELNLGASIVYSGSIVQDYNDDISPEMSALFAIKSHILVAYGEKASANRDNLLLKKSEMTIDNRNQAADHAKTIEDLEAELQRRLIRYYNDNISGVRVV
jgi:hypothetical protein